VKIILRRPTHRILANMQVGSERDGGAWIDAPMQRVASLPYHHRPRSADTQSQRAAPFPALNGARRHGCAAPPLRRAIESCCEIPSLWLSTRQTARATQEHYVVTWTAAPACAARMSVQGGASIVATGCACGGPIPRQGVTRPAHSQRCTQCATARRCDAQRVSKRAPSRRAARTVHVRAGPM
jgi:hypothetical protein